MPLLALFRLAFASAPAVTALTLPHTLTRRLILQKARGQAFLLALPPSVSERFQVLFHSPHRGSFHLSLTVLVRYRSSRVFSLGKWSSRLPTGLACPVVLWHPAPCFRLSCTGLSPSPVGLSSALPLPYLQRPAGPSTPPTRTVSSSLSAVWAVPLSLATTRGIVSFPPGTKMFQFPGFPPSGYVFTSRCQPFRWRVSPFGHQRFFACTRLPAAFRSVPRPSSALDAQASPVRLLLPGLSCGDRARSCSYTNAIRVGLFAGLLLGYRADPPSVFRQTDQRAFSYSVVKVPLQSFFSLIAVQFAEQTARQPEDRL